MSPIAVCSQCGASADNGHIFCPTCGVALRPPQSLLSSSAADAGASIGMSVLKRAAVMVIRALGVMAAIGFLVARVTTYPGILWFVASIAVGGLCIAALAYLDDNFIKENGHEGYWPKPLDWNSPSNNSTNEKPPDYHLD